MNLSAPTVRATTRQAKNYMSRFTYIYILPAKLSQSGFTLAAPRIFAGGYHPTMQGTSVTQEDGNRGALKLTLQF